MICRCRHFVVLGECHDVDGAQWLGVADGGDASSGLCNSSRSRGTAMVVCRGTIDVVKDSVSVKHWDSARDLVGSDPPTSDDLPTTLAGEPLDSVDKVREFLANLDRARPA